MNMQKNKTVFLLAVLLMNGSLLAENKVTVEKESSTAGNEQESYIVRFGDQELPHFTIKDIVPEKQWDTLESFQKDNKAFNRMIFGQAAVVGAAGFACAQNYIDDKDSALNPRNYAPYNKLMSQVGKLHIGARWAIAGTALAGSIGYTLWKFNRMFYLGNILEEYQWEKTVDSSVIFYRKMIYSHTIYTQNGAINIYYPGDPVGWMTYEEHKAEFEPLYNARRNFYKWLVASLVYCAATTYMGATSTGGHSG